MASRGLMKSCNVIVDIIRKEGTISNVNLVLKTNKSPSHVEKMRPFILELFHDITYEKGMWTAIKVEQIS